MANSLTTHLLTTDELGAWDALVTDAGASVFHRSSFLNLLAPHFGKEAQVLGAFSGDVLIGGWPLYTRKRLGITLANPPLMSGYCGPVLKIPPYRSSGRTMSETLQVLTQLNIAMQERFGYARFVADPLTRDVRPFLWSDWDIVPRYTTRVALTSAEEVEAGFRKSLRKKLRKAEKNGIVMRAIADIDTVASAYAESYQRKGDAPPLAAETLARITREAVAAGLARAYVAEDADGAPHAFQVMFHDEKRCYAWAAGSFAEHISAGAFPFLLRCIMHEWAGKAESFDFMGANTPTILEFKQAFGGDLVSYWEGSFATPLARGLLRTAETAKRLRP